MPMENNWDFDCTLKINPELLTAYNETNHADFELLPDNCYTLAEKVSFVSGKSTSIATVKINIPDDLKFGKYMLPIDRKSTRLNSSHRSQSRMPSSA